MKKFKTILIFTGSIIVLVLTIMLFKQQCLSAEPCNNKHLRFEDTGCTCSATIDEGCTGYFMTGYCDAASGTICTQGVNCVLIYNTPCNGKSQESCNNLN